MAEWEVELQWVCLSCRTIVLGRHDKCTACGNPHTTEAYLMPDDVAEAQAVTDAKLVELSRAGANWHCTFCGSSQRAKSGECARCGAGQANASPPSPAGRPTPDVSRLGEQTVAASQLRTRLRGTSTLKLSLLGASLFVLAGGSCALAIHQTPRSPRPAVPASAAATTAAPDGPIEATFTSGSFRRRIVFEKKELTPNQGFDVPTGAQQVEPQGLRQHHTNRVQAGFTSETYTVQVPDGYRSETYTERESCGQDCTDRPQSCRKVCTNNKNGFASCKDVCSGGGRSCTTKYCTITKTRQIPKTRTDTRTRQIPKFVDVPVNAPYFAWREWTWVESRTAEAVGEGDALTWPPAQASKDERERREETFSVVFTTKSGERLTYAPSDEMTYLQTLKLTDVRLERSVTGAVQRVLP